MTSRTLSWKSGSVCVESLGGMLGPTQFALPDGRAVSPFQIAPWADEPGTDDLPGVLKRLRGEWPCVPFGSDAGRAASGDWQGSTAQPTVDENPHGFAANNEWSFGAGNDDAITLKIDYPEDHPIKGLERRVTPDPDAAALDFELRVKARRDCTLPFGLHPCFRLPVTPGQMHIEAGPELSGFTFPGDADTSSIFAPGQIVRPWNVVPLRDGGVLDVSRVPLEQHTEDLLQVLDVPGTIALRNVEENFRVKLSWNPDDFPSVLLWFSNYGRQFAPWNGRHLALGVEPICSAFDLGPQISADDNPISRRGIKTARNFRAEEDFVTHYRVEVEALA